MASHASSTTAPAPTAEPDFEEMAAMKFRRAKLDLKSLPNAEQINNPYMVSARTAAAVLNQSKAELIKAVRELGPETTKELSDRLMEAEKLFKYLAQLCSSADSRLFIAACNVECG